jgi:multidrug efflux system membrane fusion protein
VKPDIDPHSSATEPVQRLGSDGEPGGNTNRRKLTRWLLPVVALAAGMGVYSLLVATREKPVTADFIPISPLVRIQSVELQPLRLSVVTRGTVTPRTESDLVAEVSGRILSLSPQLVVGGFFETGDELLRLDPRQYRIARDRTRATVSLRESEERLASSEAARRRQLSQRGAASAADLEQFVSRERVAEASLAESRAILEQAELDLEHTVVRAPFDGRVRERNVDVGRFVSSGTKLGRVFAVDYAEVRLPIQMDDLAFLEGAFSGGNKQGGQPGSIGLEGARVKLTGRLGGRDYDWAAHLDRAEAAIDERTRMLHVVARVENPYGRSMQDDSESSSVDSAIQGSGHDSDFASMPPVSTVVTSASEREVPAGLISNSIPLPAGLFVEAEIEGRLVSDVAVLPLMALRDGGRVFVFEEEVPGALTTDPAGSSEAEVAGVAEGWLRVRDVSVLRRDRDRVVIDEGLETGDQVVISPLRIYSDGMRLRVVEARDF